MLKSLRTTVVLATGSLALGLLGAAPAVATHHTAPAAASQVPTVHKPQGKVVSNRGLNIRSRATSNSTILGSFRSGATINLSCKVHGQNVAGNTIWYKLSGRSGYVTARYVKNLQPVKFC